MAYYTNNGPVRALIAVQFADGTIRWAVGTPEEWTLERESRPFYSDRGYEPYYVAGPTSLTLRMMVDEMRDGFPDDVRDAMRENAQVEGGRAVLPAARKALPPGGSADA